MRIDPGMAVCSMRGEVRRLADRGVIHVQVTAD
jgi:hypothetical protein